MNTTLKGGVHERNEEVVQEVIGQKIQQEVVKEEDVALIWSYGGGTQSVAIAVLVAQRKLSAPECVVIADTGREASETWQYTERYVKPVLADLGLQIEVASHDLATVDLYGKNGDLLIPAYTSTNGKMATFCSTEWKKRVVQRYLRSKGYGPRKPVRQWMGISLDEMGRAKPSGTPWQEHHWPLILDYPMRRAECVELVKSAGLPQPPKSSCWMCPFRQNSQWRNLKENFPGDWKKAVELDEEVRRQDATHDVYVHRSGVPLKHADLEDRDSAQLVLFGDMDGCDSGFCMV